MGKALNPVWLALITTLAGISAPAQNGPVYYWRTFAGQHGVIGTNDGVGTNAQFNRPEGIVVDGAGNVYLADTYSYTIRKIAPDATVSTLAGVAGVSGTNDGTGTNALFAYPYALALDGQTNLYVTDLAHGYVRKVTGTGAVTTLGFAGPDYANLGMAIDTSTNIFLTTDESFNPILELPAAGDVVALSIPQSGRATPFKDPIGIAVDSATNLYVCDGGYHIVRKLTQSGTNWPATTLAGNSGQQGTKDGVGTNALFESPDGMALDSATNLYVGDGTALRKISSTGAVMTIGGAPPPGGYAEGTNSAARFGFISGVAVDNAGNVYVADVLNNLVVKGTLLPPLVVRSDGSNVIVSWPSSFNGWTLQQNSDAGNPAGWTASSYPTNDDGTNKSIVVAPTPGALFFRLQGN